MIHWRAKDLQRIPTPRILARSSQITPTRRRQAARTRVSSRRPRPECRSSTRESPASNSRVELRRNGENRLRRLARSLRDAGAIKTEHNGGRFSYDLSWFEAQGLHEVTLRIRAAGFRDLIVRSIDFSHGAILDLGDLPLESATPLHLKVVDAVTGGVIEGAGDFAASKRKCSNLESVVARLDVEAAHESGSFRFGATNRRGELKIPAPAAGPPFLIVATAEGFIPSPIESVGAPGDVVTIEMRRGATAIVRVVDSSGMPVPRAPVRLQAASGRLHGEEILLCVARQASGRRR